MFSCDPVFRALLRRGHAVVVTDFNETGLHTAAKEDDWEGLAHSHSASDSLEAPTPRLTPRLVLRRMDVTRRTQWQMVMREISETWGGLDVCFNIAVRAGVARPPAAARKCTAKANIYIGARPKHAQPPPTHV